ncbi:hypothetical protein [Methyloglobulus sp.]|uniref:hypothetical protein n=1 Tax=Methyloglobulus sp. TaxID=2518622 RepID=UPI0032B78013
MCVELKPRWDLSNHDALALLPINSGITQQFMPCIHKFANDLNLERIDFEPTILIVGTFNPGWNNLGNYAQWFYGRTNNNYFWDVLPRLYENSNLRLVPCAEWKAFCSHHKIALTDLIYSIDDADSDNQTHINQLKNYRDDAIARHFHRFTLVDIPAILENHPTITHAYLTRQTSANFWQQKWLPIVQYCNENGIKTQILLTPSGSARFQMPKSTDITLRDFIFKRWQNSWHSL